MKRKVDKEAIRAAQREAYLTAWKDANPDHALPDIEYHAGWWRLRPDWHETGWNYRTADLLEMTRSLEKMAVRK